MLIIRPEQVAALERAALERFVRGRLPEMRRAWPSRCAGMSDEELFDDLRDAAQTAVQHGIGGAESLTAFLHLRMKLGFRFPEAPPFTWARQILAERTLPDHQRLARIIARIAGGE